MGLSPDILACSQPRSPSECEALVWLHWRPAGMHGEGAGAAGTQDANQQSSNLNQNNNTNSYNNNGVVWWCWCARRIARLKTSPPNAMSWRSLSSFLLLITVPTDVTDKSRATDMTRELRAKGSILKPQNPGKE